MTAPLIDSSLEELFDLELPCEGVAQVRPPCGAAATWTMSFSHGCPLLAPMKCDDCRRIHVDELQQAAEDGGFECAHCGRDFYSADDFVRYRRV